MRRAVVPLVGALHQAKCVSEQRRGVKFLYSGYWGGFKNVWQLAQGTEGLPKSYRVGLYSKYGVRPAAAQEKESSAADSPLEWDAEAAGTSNTKATSENQQGTEDRKYAPLTQASRVELQGDFMIEGGMYQEALQQYGVAMTVYEAAYPAVHTKLAEMHLKLARAFRLTNRYEPAKQNLERALRIVDDLPDASVGLELVCEILLELGQTMRAIQDPDTGNVFEDVAVIVSHHHDFGESHRRLRHAHKLNNRINISVESKFVYFSPFDYDRAFSIADKSLQVAEQWYEDNGDDDAVIRVLTARKHLHDKKMFNMRTFHGVIRKRGGHRLRRQRFMALAPTNEELLKLTPTVHQPVFDYNQMHVAPNDRINEVKPGPNRKIIDDGDPMRNRPVYRDKHARQDGLEVFSQQQMWETQ